MASPRQEDKTVHDTARKAAEDVRKSGEEGARRGAEGATQLGRSALEAGEHVARSGTQFMQQNADMFRSAWRSYLDILARTTGRPAEELAHNFGLDGPFGLGDVQAATERSTRNVEAIADSGSVIAKGVEDIAREWFGFARGRIEHNLARFGEFSRCRSPQEVAAVHSEMMRDNLEVLLQISRRVAEISVRVAEDAMDRMAETVEKPRRAA